MPNGKEQQDVASVIYVAKGFMERCFPRNAFLFDELLKDVIHEGGLPKLADMIKARLRPRLRDDSLSKDYSLANIQDSAWSTLNILVRLQDKLRSQKKSIGLEALRILIEDCIAEVDVPMWLHHRAIKHLPVLVLEGFVDKNLATEVTLADKPYVVYCGNDLPSDCDASDLLDFRKLGRKGHFDIYLNDIPRQREVLVRGEPDRFRPGNRLPYRMLRFLLSRVGREVSYTELRTILWSPSQIRERTGFSKIIHDRLAAIRKQLRESESVAENEPEKWFQKTTVRGVIYVWEGLNSCLITTPAKLWPNLR